MGLYIHGPQPRPLHIITSSVVISKKKNNGRVEIIQKGEEAGEEEENRPWIRFWIRIVDPDGNEEAPSSGTGREKVEPTGSAYIKDY